MHKALVATIMGLVASGPVRAAEGDFRVTLLDTASPVPRVDRFGPSTLVEAGRRSLHRRTAELVLPAMRCHREFYGFARVVLTHQSREA